MGVNNEESRGPPKLPPPLLLPRVMEVWLWLWLGFRILGMLSGAGSVNDPSEFAAGLRDPRLTFEPE